MNMSEDRLDCNPFKRMYKAGSTSVRNLFLVACRSTKTVLGRHFFSKSPNSQYLSRHSHGNCTEPHSSMTFTCITRSYKHLKLLNSFSWSQCRNYSPASHNIPLEATPSPTDPENVVNFALPKTRTVHKEGSPLTTKRIVRRKRTKDSPPSDQEVFDVLAYATADKCSLKTLKKDLENQGLYGYIPLPEDFDEALHVEAMYGVEDESRSIFFFQDGSVVFWNMPQVERDSVLKHLKRHQEGSYQASLVHEEFEHIEYTYTVGNTKLQGDAIYLNQLTEGEDKLQRVLEKFAFSNALALSVKLAIWEAKLEQYTDSIEYVLHDLKEGKKIKLSETDVLRKSGLLLSLRHLINLRSDLLDPPDAYWDHEDLEQLYNRTYAYLDIAKRTRVMNDKLNHCCELTNMLLELLKDKHHTRLEWMIIILIMIEVVFEIFHTYERRSTGGDH